MRSAAILAALTGLSPFEYLLCEDEILIQTAQAVAERANDYLNKRDASLAKAIGSEVTRGIAKLLKRK